MLTEELVGSAQERTGEPTEVALAVAPAAPTKPETFLIYDLVKLAWWTPRAAGHSPVILEAGLFDRDLAREIVKENAGRVTAIPVIEREEEIRRLCVAAERMQRALGFAVLAVTCLQCGRRFSEQEAAAGYETCEHCPPVDVSTTEGAARRIARALQADPVFITHVVSGRPDWIHLETEAGHEYVVTLRRSVVAPDDGQSAIEEIIEVDDGPVFPWELWRMSLVWGHEVALATIQGWPQEVIDQAGLYVAMAIAHELSPPVPEDEWPEAPAELEAVIGRQLYHPTRHPLGHRPRPRQEG
jgi:hypothetical protein